MPLTLLPWRVRYTRESEGDMVRGQIYGVCAETGHCVLGNNMRSGWVADDAAYFDFIDDPDADKQPTRGQIVSIKPWNDYTAYGQTQHAPDRGTMQTLCQEPKWRVEKRVSKDMWFLQAQTRGFGGWSWPRWAMAGITPPKVYAPVNLQLHGFGARVLQPDSGLTVKQLNEFIAADYKLFVELVYEKPTEHQSHGPNQADWVKPGCEPNTYSGVLLKFDEAKSLITLKCLNILNRQTAEPAIKSFKLASIKSGKLTLMS